MSTRMNPDERFRGRVRYRRGQIPWHWTVWDAKKRQMVAWGEEFHFDLAQREARRATAGARWWHWYRR